MKIRGNTVGTTINPEKSFFKATRQLTEEQKAQARKNIGAASKDNLLVSSGGVGAGIPQHLTEDIKENSGTKFVCDDYKSIKLENLIVFGQSTTDKTPEMDNPATISGVTSPTVTGSKNLIPKFTSGTGDNGGTFTVRNDGSIRFTGASTMTADTTKIGVTFFLDAGDYIISGDPVYSNRANNFVYIYETSNGANKKFLARSYFYKKNEKEPDDDVFTLTARTEVTAYVCVGKASAKAYEEAYKKDGVTHSLPLVFYPMVRRVDTDETYAAPATKTFTGITLHGVGDAKDCIDSASRKIVRHVGVVTFTGADSEGWNKSSTSVGNRFSVRCDNLNVTGQGLSNRFGWGSANPLKTGTFWFTQNGDKAYIEVLTDATNNAQTLDQFRTWLGENNLTVYYPLKTPIEESITDDALLEACQTLLKVSDTSFTSTAQISVKYVERKVITFSNTAEMIANFKEEDKICYVLNDDSYYCKGYKGNYYVYKYDKTYVDRDVKKTYPEIALAKGGYAGLVIPEFKPLKHNYACMDKVLDIAYSYCGKDIQYVTSNGPITHSAHEGIQCSQFVNTLLLGLYYDKSRLADSTSDNPLCAGGCKWLLEEDYRKADSQIRSPANTFCLGAEGLARFAAARGWLNHTQYLTDCEVGDLLFFAEATPKNLAGNWNGVGHVGMVIGKEEKKDDSGNQYTAVQFIQAGGVGDTTSERVYPDGNGGEIEFTLDENGKIIAPQAVCIQTIKDYGKPYILSSSNGSTGRYCLVGYGRLPMYYEDEGVISTEKAKEVYADNIANALLTTKIGNVIKFDDVSPMHGEELKLNLRVTDASLAKDAKAVVYGKNLLNYLDLANGINCIAYPETKTFTLNKTSTHYTTNFAPTYIPANTPFVIRGTITRRPNPKPDVVLIAKYANGSTSTALTYPMGKVITHPNDIVAIRFNVNGNATVGHGFTISNLSLEIGEPWTEYVDYVEPQEVTGVKVPGTSSDYTAKFKLSREHGTTIFVPTGFTGSVTYGRDLVKAFAELQNAIISLGRNL